ncbi:hypothetical protein [Thermus sp.]|uniref:hypothetical protein n=1 Tax=Thermus sp. TaxID=275 RepID=UPI003D0B6212
MGGFVEDGPRRYREAVRPEAQGRRGLRAWLLGWLHRFLEEVRLGGRLWLLRRG